MILANTEWHRVDTSALLSANSKAAYKSGAYNVQFVTIALPTETSRYDVLCKENAIDTVINSLHSNEYSLSRTMPIQIEWDDSGEFIATFGNAGISMSGDLAHEALSLLRDHLITVYRKFKNASKLGPEAKRQLIEPENQHCQRAGVLLRREAEKIATKLGATIEKQGKHDAAYVYYGEELVIQFGLRRDRYSPHGHIPLDMRINEHQALELARVT